VTPFLANILTAAGPSTTIGPTATTAKASRKAGASLLDPIAKPIAWVLEHIYAVIPNYGVAILVLSVLWMLIIAPLTLKSTRSMLAMQKLQPQLKKLQEQHRNDRQAFAQAQMELFKEHNVSPFGACLPTLLPFPVFFALYRVITGLGHKSTVNGHIIPTPKYLSHGSQMYMDIVHAGGQLKAFGMDLSLNAFSKHPSLAAAAPFWILLVIMAGTGYMQSAQMLSRNPAAAQNPQMRLMKYLPLFFVVIFARLPAGVLVYYAMSNVARIVQQDLMYRFDPKVKALVTQEVQEVEALTHEIDDAGSASSSRRPRSGGTSQPGSSGPTVAKGRFQRLLATAREEQERRNAGKGSSAPIEGGSAASRSGGGSPKSSAKDRFEGLAGNGKPAKGRPSKSQAGNGQAPRDVAKGATNQPRNGQSPKGAPPSSGGRTGAGAGGAPRASGVHRTNRKRRRR
jgi:YidC/Oxa1 family membrane protein insertase